MMGRSRARRPGSAGSEIAAGLAAFPRDSGTRRGHRPIRGGRAEVGQALSMAAIPAA